MPDQVQSPARRPAEIAWVLAAALFVGGISAYRLTAVSRARHPGHADPAFYYGVAENLRSGRGPAIDYVWQFLNGMPPLHHYAFDYWLPLPSVLMWAALGVHESISAALSVSVLMSVVLAAATYWLARQLTASAWAPGLAAAIIVAQPVVTRFSVQSESAIYLGAFATLAAAAAVAARSRPVLWPLAGAFAGLANLSRNEGLLLITVIVLVAAIWPGRGRAGVAALTAAAGYLVVMTPLLVLDLQNAGTLLPGGTGRTPFVGTYEDIYSPNVNASLGALFPHGPFAFLLLRARMLMSEVAAAFASMSPIDAVLLILLFGSALTRQGPRWRVGPAWFVPAGFALTVVAFYAVVVPVVGSGGGFDKAMAALAPTIVVGAIAQLDKLAYRPSVIAAFAAVLLVAPLLSEPSAASIVENNNATGDSAAALGPALRAEQSCIGKPVVLMTRNPWEITEATSVPTVMIPNAPLPEILDVAQRYGVTDIQLNPTRAWALDAAVEMADSGQGPLATASTFPDRSVYRIRGAVGATTC